MIGVCNPSSMSRQPKAFTLLETIVSVAIFGILVVLLVGMFTNTIAIERRAIATQTALDNTRYTLEIMARAIRQAGPNSFTSLVGVCPTTGTLTFTHPTKGNVTYTSSGNAIQETSNTTGGSSVSITPSSVKVTRLNFTVCGQTTSDKWQPTVTISMRVAAASNANAAADIEETVSVRSFQE